MRHNVPWELYDRDAIASAAHFLGYEGRWRFLLPQPGPASSLVNAEGQNKYQEKSLWINEWFSRSFFLVRIKILSCWSSSDDILLFSLLWLLSQLALMTQWRTCQLFVLGWFWDSRHQWFTHISHFYNQQYHTTTLMQISITGYIYIYITWYLYNWISTSLRHSRWLFDVSVSHNIAECL